MQQAPYRRIPLRAKDGSVRACALVDVADFDAVIQHRWRLHEHGYAIRHHENWRNSSNVRMHREIMGVADRNIYVDHINGDPLDNRRANLRIATHA